MRRSHVLVPLALLVVLALTSGALAASADLGTANDVHVPEQTETIDGKSYQIDAVGQVQQGDQLVVDVAAESGQSFNVDLYNRDEVVVDFKDGDGDATVEFDTENLDPGTYALALVIDGSTEAIHPVVVSDYQLSVSAPAEPTVDEPMNVTVDVGEQVAAGETVEVGLYRDGTELQATATHVGGGTYVASVTPDSTGDWTMYAAVRASSGGSGYPDSTGIANGQTVSVVEPASDGGDGSGDDTGGTSGGSTGGDDSGGSSGDSDTGGTDDGGTTDGGSTDAGGSDDGGTNESGGTSDGGTTTDGGASGDDGTSDDDGGADADGASDGGDTDGTTDDGTDDAGSGDSTADDGGTDDGNAGTDDPMQPNEPAEDEGTDGGDDSLSLSWLVPVIAVLAAALALARVD